MTFVSAVHAALELPSRGDVTSAVHEVVGNALRQLDAQIDVRHTDYFGHTFVPDLVMRWGPAEHRRERHVHLRFSVVSAPFSEDLRLLGDQSPLFLGMTDDQGLANPPWLEFAEPRHATLVTQTQAIDELEGSMVTDRRSRKATSALVRDGHGLVDEPQAERVASSYVAALHAIADVTAATSEARPDVESALAVLADLLQEEGQLDVERALQSEWIRHGGDPYDFPSTTPWNPELLDTASLREVLLGLLGSEAAVLPETWQRNAGFIRIEDLGRILGKSMRGGAFNAMAHALLPNWTAKWVWSERTDSPPLFTAYDWIVDSGTVGIETNDLRTFFADDGRHFKDKEGGNPLPRLPEAQAMLSQPGVLEVALRSPMEGLRYEPLARTGQLFNRIQEILSAPGAGNYRVQGVSTVVPGTDSDAEIDLDRQVIDLKGKSTPVATLARLATRFFSRASRPEGLDHFLATGESPEANE